VDANRSALSLVQRQWLWLLPLGFLAVFFFYPLLSILSVSFAPNGVLDLSGFAEIAFSPYYRDTFVFTLAQAALSTLLTLALALPGAYVFTTYRFPGKALFSALAGLPFVLPTIVVAAAYLALLGPRGVLNQFLTSVFVLDAPPIQLERTLTVILIAHVFYNYGVAFRILAAAWSNRSPRIEEAARSFGVSGWRLWWRVRLPLILPAFFAAAALVFIYTFTSFGVIVVLGGPRFATLEVEIYRQIANLFDLPTAGALSVVQIGFMFITLSVYSRLERRANVALRQTPTRPRLPRQRYEKLMIWANIGFLSLFLAAPLLALVLRSFTSADQTLTLAYYRNLAFVAPRSVLNVPPALAIGNSLLIALVATALSVLLGIITARLLTRPSARNLGGVETLFMLPLATSAVVLGFGYNIALDEPPLNLRSSPALIPLAHALVALPFVLRSLSPALRAIPLQLEAAAQSLGAKRLRVFRRVVLPLILPSVTASALFAFTISMGEFGATLFVARPDSPTLPIAIFRLLGQPGDSNYGQALALSTLLLVICGIAFWCIEWVQKRGSDRGV
jgi:thiamine transport system permease protein